jgi:FkbM family methyltransferase
VIRPAPRDPIEVETQLWEGWSGNIGWDIGANVGQSIQHMTAAFKKIYAFEPNEDALRMLIACEFDERGVVVNPIAVSDHNGTVELAALPSLAETGQLTTPGTHGMEWDPEAGWDNIPHVTVPCRTVDSLAYDLGVPDFIKVDTEGHEDLVLRGATHILELGQTDWLIEFHTPELRRLCIEQLVAVNYQVVTVRHPHYVPQSAMYYQHGWLRCTAPKGKISND